MLREVFDDRLIARRSERVRSPRSCDPTPVDLDFTGTNRIIQEQTVGEHRTEIRRMVGEINGDRLWPRSGSSILTSDDCLLKNSGGGRTTGMIFQH